MAVYDSDSSGGEDNDYTETNVLLGYASKEPSDDTISHLGGSPTWLDPSTPPSAALAKCKVCNDLMVLLLQLNGDLPEQFPGHERRLYVLTCRRKTCRRKEGSVRVLRGTRISTSSPAKERKEKPTPKAESAPSKPVINIGETLFGGKPSSSSGSTNPFSTNLRNSNFSNPFSTSSSSSTTTTQQNPFTAAGLEPLSELAAKAPQNPSESTITSHDLPKTFASALSLNNDQATDPKYGPLPPPEPWPTDSFLLPKAYPLYYLVDADYETLDNTGDDIPIPVPTIDMDEGSSRGGGKEDKDVFESSIDKTFQKFADRLAQNPEQVLRYEFRGVPLLYSRSDSVGKLLSSSKDGENVKVKVGGGGGSGIPKCGNCGKGRVFEAQLTPHAILELEREEVGVDGMEWGTVLVGVCEEDCVPRGVREGETRYVEEWAGVQWEEMEVRR